MGVEVKVCGITNEKDARKSLKAGAHYLGFIFHPKSPRYISLDYAGSICENLKDFSFKKVAVDVSPVPADVLQMKQAGFEFYQFHFPLELKEEKVRQWSKIVGVSNLWLAPKLLPGIDFPEYLLEYADTFLIDSYSQDKFGGTGKSADWESFAKYQDLYPEKKWILAGGIGPKNVISSIRMTHARMVDLNSAVEAKPGQKDLEKIKSVIEALKRESFDKQKINNSYDKI